MSTTTAPIPRLRDWQSRLQALLAEREAQPFAWGANDCALFVCDAVLAITTHDPAADVRGTYDTALGAARVVEQLGGMAAIGATRFGAEILPAQAQVGDIGLAELDGRETLLMCGGAVWLGPGEAGLQRVPASQIRSAWRCV